MHLISLERASTVREAARFGRDRRANALVEFAFAAPIVLSLGLYGIELGNQSLVNMRISQIALNLADNASRSGQILSTNVEQLREGDVNDVLQAARLQGASFNLTSGGRITISSLENVKQSYDTAPVQRIHWQRCIGLRQEAAYQTTYAASPPQYNAGITKKKLDAGWTLPGGMGDHVKVNAPVRGEVMFVEINYEYQPLFGNIFVGKKKLHYTASAIVRDSRDFSWIDNPAPAVNRMTCDKYTASAV